MTRESREISFRLSIEDVTSEELAREFLDNQLWDEVDDAWMANEYVAADLAMLRAGLEEYSDYITIEENTRGSSVRFAVETVAENHRRQQEEAVIQEYIASQPARADDVTRLVNGLEGYGGARATIMAVLRGEQNAINDAARHVRVVARAREANGSAPPNSHGSLFQLLRHSRVPGSEDARRFAQQHGGSHDTEAARRDVAAAEVQSLVARAQAGERESATSILNRLGLGDPPQRLGQPIDAPTEPEGDNTAEAMAALQHIATGQEGRQAVSERLDDAYREVQQRQARTVLRNAVRNFMQLYDGDLHYTMDVLVEYVRGYCTQATAGRREATTVLTVLSDTLLLIAEGLAEEAVHGS